MIRLRAILTASVLLCLPLAGCSAIMAAATADADSKQKPEVLTYASTKAADQVFTASIQTLTSMGKVVTSDRASGIAQGQKGNWVINAMVLPKGTGSEIQVSARYVPSQQLDFNSREGLTKEFVTGLGKALGENLIQK